MDKLEKLAEFTEGPLIGLVDGMLATIILPTVVMDWIAEYKGNEDRIGFVYFDDRDLSSDSSLLQIVASLTAIGVGAFSTLVASTGFPFADKYNFSPMITTQLASLGLEAGRYFYNKIPRY
jgi:hypothetical protein